MDLDSGIYSKSSARGYNERSNKYERIHRPVYGWQARKVKSAKKDNRLSGC